MNPCLCNYLVLFVIENTAAHPLVSLTSLVGRLPLTSHVGGGRVVGPTSRNLVLWVDVGVGGHSWAFLAPESVLPLERRSVDLSVNVTGDIRQTVPVALAHGQDDDNDKDNDSTHNAQDHRQPRERWVRTANSNHLRLQ
ncbi:hypothetical protein NP493_66g04043 [Ridgeia piscesae]|uniref:Secreted protein n=1 Tax=Ridgeia piscesae TaxID=27915 RepID=A0AAD9UIR8_RIDPI|nr:hypothetical protein NP493_66g04043 [Ridgeia piscesae]